MHLFQDPISLLALLIRSAILKPRVDWYSKCHLRLAEQVVTRDYFVDQILKKLEQLKQLKANFQRT